MLPGSEPKKPLLQLPVDPDADLTLTAYHQQHHWVQGMNLNAQQYLLNDQAEGLKVRIEMFAEAEKKGLVKSNFRSFNYYRSPAVQENFRGRLEASVSTHRDEGLDTEKLTRLAMVLNNEALEEFKDPGTEMQSKFTSVMDDLDKMGKTVRETIGLYDWIRNLPAGADGDLGSRETAARLRSAEAHLQRDYEQAAKDLKEIYADSQFPNVLVSEYMRAREAVFFLRRQTNKILSAYEKGDWEKLNREAVAFDNLSNKIETDLESPDRIQQLQERFNAEQNKIKTNFENSLNAEENQQALLATLADIEFNNVDEEDYRKITNELASYYSKIMKETINGMRVKSDRRWAKRYGETARDAKAWQQSFYENTERQKDVVDKYHIWFRSESGSIASVSNRNGIDYIIEQGKVLPNYTEVEYYHQSSGSHITVYRETDDDDKPTGNETLSIKLGSRSKHFKENRYKAFFAAAEIFMDAHKHDNVAIEPHSDVHYAVEMRGIIDGIREARGLKPLGLNPSLVPQAGKKTSLRGKIPGLNKIFGSSLSKRETDYEAAKRWAKAHMDVHGKIEDYLVDEANEGLLEWEPQERKVENAAEEEIENRGEDEEEYGEQSDFSTESDTGSDTESDTDSEGSSFGRR